MKPLIFFILILVEKTLILIAFTVQIIQSLPRKGARYELDLPKETKTKIKIMSRDLSFYAVLKVLSQPLM